MKRRQIFGAAFAAVVAGVLPAMQGAPAANRARVIRPLSFKMTLNSVYGKPLGHRPKPPAWLYENGVESGKPERMVCACARPQDWEYNFRDEGLWT